MILLDTHVLVWMVASPKQLSRPAAREIRKAQQSGGCAIASISLWELSLLFEKGRLRSSGVPEASIREIVETAAVTVLEITTDIAALTAMFPESYPKDPADPSESQGWHYLCQRSSRFFAAGSRHHDGG